MITDAILNFFIAIVKVLSYPFTTLVPNFTLNISEIMPSSTLLSSMFSHVSYFFPISLALVLISINVAMFALNLAISIIIRIKSFIPTMGA